MNADHADPPAPEGAVVVGFEPSAAGRRALTEGLVQAKGRRRPLHLLHAVDLPLAHDSSDVAHLTRERRALHEALTGIRHENPGLGVSGGLSRLSATDALVAASGTAELVLVGATGAGEFGRVLTGGVAGRVAARASCPVIVVRSAPRVSRLERSRPVVVGLDADPDPELLRFALEEARIRGRRLHVVHVWPGPTVRSRSGRPWESEPLTDAGAVRTARRRLLVAGTAAVLDAFPDVEVEFLVAHGAHVAEELLGLSLLEQAVLVVLGAGRPGRGGLGGAALGSVTTVLADHLPCSLAVFRHRTGLSRVDHVRYLRLDEVRQPGAAHGVRPIGAERAGGSG